MCKEDITWGVVIEHNEGETYLVKDMDVATGQMGDPSIYRMEKGVLEVSDQVLTRRLWLIAKEDVMVFERVESVADGWGNIYTNRYTYKFSRFNANSKATAVKEVARRKKAAEIEESAKKAEEVLESMLKEEQERKAREEEEKKKAEAAKQEQELLASVKNAMSQVGKYYAIVGREGVYLDKSQRLIRIDSFDSSTGNFKGKLFEDDKPVEITGSVDGDNNVKISTVPADDVKKREYLFQFNRQSPTVLSGISRIGDDGEEFEATLYAGWARNFTPMSAEDLEVLYKLLEAKDVEYDVGIDSGSYSTAVYRFVSFDKATGELHCIARWSYQRGIHTETGKGRLVGQIKDGLLNLQYVKESENGPSVEPGCIVLNKLQNGSLCGFRCRDGSNIPYAIDYIMNCIPKKATISTLSFDADNDQSWPKIDPSKLPTGK